MQSKEDATAFLRQILPSEGYYVACVKKPNEGMKQRFVKTIDELVDILFYFDGLGYETYHGCAAYNEAGNRRQANVKAVKSFWLDIDVAPKSGYADAYEAAKAVASFSHAMGIPLPIFVSSGNGLHCYWVLDASITRAEWELYATGLKQACIGQLDAGPERTADCASILRTPGTHHHKTEVAKEVIGQPVTHTYSLDTFGRFLMNGHKPFNSPKGNISLVNKGLNTQIYNEVKAVDIVDHCAQLANMRDTRGNMQEPLWYSLLGVLHYCADGREKAHEWSSGHPGYSYSETEKKLQQIEAKTTGATRCDKIYSLNPSLCNNCVFRGRINSPISIHADPIELVEPVAFDDTHTLPALRAPFGWDENKALIIKADRRGGTQDIVLSSNPIYLKRINRAERIGEVADTYYSFEHYLPKEGWHTIDIPAHTFVGPGGLQELTRHGANITDWPNFKKAVNIMVDQYNAEHRMGTQYVHFGWKDDDSFLYGDTLYTSKGSMKVSVSTNLLRRTKFLRPTVGGSVGKWTEVVSKFFQKGLEAQAFAILCAPASVLLRFISPNEGGAIVHLVGGSGRGKTSSLELASSFWGQYEGLRLTTDDTKVSKALIMGTLGNLPVTWDELTARDPETMTEMVRTFTEGRDRARATQSGELKSVELTWCAIMTSTSNQSVRELLVDTPNAEGMSFRVIELYATVPKTLAITEVDAMKQVAAANAGHAGDLFLRYLMMPETLAYVKQMLPKRQEEMHKRYGFRKEHRFYSRALAAVSVAADICKKLELIEFSPNYILEWVGTQLQDAINMGPEPLGEVETEGEYAGSSVHIARLVRYLNEHVAETLVINKPFVSQSSGILVVKEPTSNRLSIRRETYSGSIFIAYYSLSRWMVDHGFSMREMMHYLVAKGIIKGNKRQISLGAGTPFSTGATACIQVDSTESTFSGIAKEEEINNVIELAASKQAKR